MIKKESQLLQKQTMICLDVVALTRQVNLNYVFNYELSAVPWSLLDASGQLLKVNKVKISHILEE